MSRRPVPTHPQGWPYKGGAGQYHVWHAGKNDYRITRGSDPQPLRQLTQFGLAHAEARRMHAVDQYYTDRNESGQAALAGYR